MVSHILIIEDDADLAEFISTLLQEQNFITKIANEGAPALKLAEKFNPDLVVLDLSLPDMDGQYLCGEIKKLLPETSVIMLTARDSVSDKVEGFNKGADDYLTKPFEPEELLARVKVRLKKSSNADLLKIGDLTLNPKAVEVHRQNKKISLTPQEFRLLEYLMTNKGVVLTREMILNRVWNYSSDVDTRVVDVYVGYLRRKVDSGYKKKLIRSVRGFGYVLKE